jgi:hypothetical protein
LPPDPATGGKGMKAAKEKWKKTSMFKMLLLLHVCMILVRSIVITPVKGDG